MKRQLNIIYLLVFVTILFSTCKKNKPVTLTIVGETTVSDITSSTAVLTGNVLEVGENMQLYGHVWGETANPDISNYKSEHTKGDAGSFTDNLTDLKSDTKYYVRTYVKDGDDIVYKDALTFTTFPDVLTVLTSEVTEISYETATCGGNVLSEGESAVTVKGVCWSESENPTIADNYTEDGTGTGAYTSELTGLSDNTTYYVRAYATNSEGTVYGEQQSFTSKSESVPVVTTTDISGILPFDRECGGEVTENGGYTVSVRGVCWSMSENPTTADNITENGSGLGSFTSNISDLKANTTYYVRAYATNNLGTGYGDQVTFTTLIVNSGDYLCGGVVYFVDNDGTSGLICSINNLHADGSTGAEWGCQGTEISGADGSEIGDGFQNTLDIEAGCTTSQTAADLCANLMLGGYDDWFLPSVDELLVMSYNTSEINATATANGGEPLIEDYYWSSTEDNSDRAIRLNVSDGTYEVKSKDGNFLYVRAIRAFGSYPSPDAGK